MKNIFVFADEMEAAINAGHISRDRAEDTYDFVTGVVEYDGTLEAYEQIADESCGG